MISTLIRSNGSNTSPPCINNARSEYLVDTESNTIIYPKTRLEDIIGLENFNPGDAGSKDDDSYFEIDKVLNSVYLPHNETTLYSIPINIPGVYLMQSFITFGNRANPALPASVGDHIFLIRDNTSNVILGHSGAWVYVGGSCRCGTSAISKITQPTSINIGFSNVSNATTIDSIYLVYKHYRLK